MGSYKLCGQVKTFVYCFAMEMFLILFSFLNIEFKVVSVSG